MRKAKKSIRVEAAALSLFIVVLAGYATFFTVGSNVKAAGGDDAANAGCAASWRQFHQQAVQNKDPNPTQKADEQNSKVPCKAEGGSGHCNAKEGSQSPKDICGAEKDQKGEPLKMPELPKKEPKKEEPKDCPNGQQKGPDGKCPCDSNQQNQPATFGADVSHLARTSYGGIATSSNPCPEQQSGFSLANFLPSGFQQSVKDFISTTFGYSPDNPIATNEAGATVDQSGDFSTAEIQRIAHEQISTVNVNPSLSTEEKEAIIAYIEARVEAKKNPLSDSGVQVIVSQPSDDLNNQTLAIRHGIETNTLVSTTGEFGNSTADYLQPNTSVNIGAKVWSLIKSIFGF